MNETDKSGSAISIRSNTECCIWECSICCGPMTVEDNSYTPCSHTFHLGCLREWMKTSSTCPVCRRKVSWAHVRRLYVQVSSPTKYNGQLLSRQKRIDELNEIITERENFIQTYDTRLAEMHTSVDRMTSKISILNESLHTPHGSPPLTRSRAKNVPAGTEKPGQKMTALIREMQSQSTARIAAERQKRREAMKKLQEERARIAELKRELRTLKGARKAGEVRRNVRENLKDAGTEENASQKKNDPPANDASIASRTRRKAPR